MSASNFSGFSRPHENFYRLPNNWFDVLASLREDTERRRIVSLVRLVEYVVKWTWGRLDFEGYVRLTFDEFQRGKVIGRSGKERIRADGGTGLPRSSLSAAIRDALAYSLLERSTDERDAARVRHAYRVRVLPDGEEGERDDLEAATTPAFAGFQSPHTNYFVVPKIWTDLTSNEASDVLILAVEYFFRHCWGWGRRDETRWMAAEEVAHGRTYRKLTAEGTLRRYDRGIRYAVDAVRRALDIGVERGWLVWRTGLAPSGRDVRLYTLRRHHWPQGKLPDNIVQGIELSNGDQYEPPYDLTEPYEGIGGQGEPMDDSSVPHNDVFEPDSDLSEHRTVIPTENLLSPRRDRTPPPARHPLAGGGAPQGRRRLSLNITLPYEGTIFRIAGDAWSPGDPLAADAVLLRDDPADGGDGGPCIAISERTAAELLSRGVAFDHFVWFPEDAASGDGHEGDLEEDRLAREKAARVQRLARVIEGNVQRWGAPSLLEALESAGVARSTARTWLAHWGEEEVGRWLQSLRADPSIRSLPAVLYRRLQSGDPAPRVRK